MWRWVSDGTPVSSDFPTQGEAEAWLTGAYEDLVDEGVTGVTLMEGDRPVYGPMSLLAD